MQKKATKEKSGRLDRFFRASEKPARISLILAAAIGFATIGSVCAVSIMSNKNGNLPSENIELNAAQQYLDQISFAATSSGEETSALPTEEPLEETSGEPLETKRGALTGENVADINDLKSLSNEDLLKAVKQGKVKVIDKKNIKQDQSQNVKTTHKGTIADAPKATSTPKPQPTAQIAATNAPTPTLGPITVINYELGIDISEFQGNIDWAKVKNDGIKFAFIRCGGRGYTAGSCYEDKKFVQNVQAARKNGIKVGVYFFSQAITVAEAVEEASLTIAMCKKCNIDLPVVMDWETGSGYRTQPLKGEAFAQVIEAFCSMIGQNGYTPAVYLCTDDINNRLGKYSGQILSKYKLWYAYPYSCYWPASKSFKSNYYQTGDTIPPRSFSYEYWQYSWHGKVAGIGTEVDLNIRILGKTTLYSPQINITNKTITSEVGQSINPMDGVKAKTSTGSATTENLSYAIRNEAGQSVTVDQAKQTAGKYIITYTFKDSLRGTITDTATWEVKAAAAAETPTPTPSGDTTLTPSPTGSAGGTGTPTPTPEASASNTPSPTPEAAPTETASAPTSTSTPTPVPTTKQEDNTENTTG